MPESVYQDLEFPPAPADRPMVFINMVSTIDGKILSGGRNEPVHLGSAADQATMHALEGMADGVLIGAGTLRATPRINIPKHVSRFCATASGKVDAGHNFFTDAPDKARLITTSGVESTVPKLECGESEVDWPLAMTKIKELGIEKLLCEGGSELNASLLTLDIVDEIFLTMAPKIRLGRDIPTIAGGDALEKEHLLRFTLVSVLPVGDEVFLRYRRHR